MKFQESNLTFEFDAKTNAVKFDDTPFYKDCFCKLPYGKGVDIVAFSKKYVLLLEIKNCLKHEDENRWRISTNNKSLSRLPAGGTANRDSLDIETSLKAAMTIACLYGAFSKHNDTPKAE